jgi:hypothetical protein
LTTRVSERFGGSDALEKLMSNRERYNSRAVLAEGGKWRHVDYKPNHINFAKDILRRGHTIKIFDPDQSWELLLQLLGGDWRKRERQNLIGTSEVTAAKALLGKIGGLALAIQQAAQLINNSDIGGGTIAQTYAEFEMRPKGGWMRFGI